MYGKCVAANYQNVSKGMCAKEFMALKDCYLVSNREWQNAHLNLPLRHHNSATLAKKHSVCIPGLHTLYSTTMP